ncbi:MAG: hypothetical protein IPP49_05245 [Saprospiraceae bacterium]|nr:hypothetical protein [Saprospiraceae bacterium]
MVIKKVFLAVALVVTLIGAQIILREKANPHLGTIEKLYPNEEHFLLKQYLKPLFISEPMKRSWKKCLCFRKTNMPVPQEVGWFRVLAILELEQIQ